MKKVVARFVWLLIAALGAWAFLVLATRRGEQINSIYILTAALCSYAIGYRFYSKWIAARVLALDDRRATPCEVHDDGKDFVKTNKWIVFGHHFAAISGPGPLVGPVLAAQFGYLPGTLWILIGVVLGGAVQDFVILFCSLRRDGRSLGQMVKDELNSTAGWVALLAILSILVILLAVLALVVVNALAESPWGVFTVGATIPIALLMGGYLRSWRVGKSLRGFGRLAWSCCCWRCGAGNGFIATRRGRSMLSFQSEPLAWGIIVYGFAASVLPIWLLLAPRDYLSTFMKLGTIFLLALGIFVAVARHPHAGPDAFRRERPGSGLRGQIISVLLHHHRLRRNLGISLAHCQRHDAQDSHARRLRADHRLRRDVSGIAGRHHGLDRRLHAGAGRLFQHQYQRRAGRNGGESFRAGLPRQPSEQMNQPGRDHWRKNAFRARGRRAHPGRRNGQGFFQRVPAAPGWTCGITSPSCSRRCLF